MFEQYENYLISLETRGVRLGLSRTKELLRRCGSPHNRIETIQIIGTNGKGSTSAILSKILESRCRVGLFNSPHLCSLRERIRVQGQKPNITGYYFMEKSVLDVAMRPSSTFNSILDKIEIQ